MQRERALIDSLATAAGFQFLVPLPSVVDPKLFFPDPDPTLTLISDPDPAC
jgi:hypothetical protein